MMCIKDKTDDFIVYDPYCGTGTTCKVAKDFGFDFIGSEIVSRYCDISNEILNRKETQTKLF